MKTFYLALNKKQTYPYVIEKRWYHVFVGSPKFTICRCKAKTKLHAKDIFVKLGYDLDMLNDND